MTWNGLDYTRRCLERLEPTLDRGMVDVIVFDNGSTDGTTDYLRELPWIKLISHPENIGFVAGNDGALPYCDPASDVVLLNNDILTEPLNPALPPLRRPPTPHPKSAWSAAGCGAPEDCSASRRNVYFAR